VDETRRALEPVRVVAGRRRRGIAVLVDPARARVRRVVDATARRLETAHLHLAAARLEDEPAAVGGVDVHLVASPELALVRVVVARLLQRIRVVQVQRDVEAREPQLARNVDHVVVVVRPARYQERIGEESLRVRRVHVVDHLREGRHGRVGRALGGRRREDADRALADHDDEVGGHRQRRLAARLGQARQLARRDRLDAERECARVPREAQQPRVPGECAVLVRQAVEVVVLAVAGKPHAQRQRTGVELELVRQRGTTARGKSNHDVVELTRSAGRNGSRLEVDRGQIRLKRRILSAANHEDQRDQNGRTPPSLQHGVLQHSRKLSLSNRAQ
jgi:hypothetical protein